MKNYNHWFWSSFILIAGATAIYFVHDNYVKSEKEKRKLKLTYVHNRAITQFSTSIDKFAAIVAGMRSYINNSKDLPKPKEFQQFVQNELDDLNYQDSIVVSFLDTTYTFQYSFTRHLIDPSHLVGKSVTSFRKPQFIERLNNLMKQEGLIMFSPLNLIEGWVGIPIDFRVSRNGHNLGHIGAIINFKTIIQKLYDEELKRDFVFHFSTKNGHDFDREQYYNGTKVYNSNTDPEYYKNFDVAPKDFLYSEVTYYGLTFMIGTAYKKPFVVEKYLTGLLVSWFLTFMFFVIILSWQIQNYKKLNSNMVQTNKLLRKKQDIIEKQNKQLSKLNEAKDKFFSIISHDIKGPLSSITGLLKLLSFEKIKDPNLIILIANLERATRNTVTLLNNLLRWARAQAGDIQFAPTQLNINRLITESLDTLKYQANEKNISLHTELKNIAELQGDENMISTIIRNLVSNAIKFTHEGGEIVIKTETINNHISMIVKDNGVGMKEEEINGLFSLDKQLTSRGTLGETGTGLGLLLCNDFVQKHGGNIEVESQPESGTVFIINFPIDTLT